MSVEITPESDPEALARRLTGGPDPSSMRSSETRRRLLERWADVLTDADLSVDFTDQDGETAHVTLGAKHPEIVVPSWEIGQPLTDIDRETYDLLIQRTLTLHEVGHILFTDGDALTQAKQSLHPDERNLFHMVFNALEDGAIEEQLRQEYEVAGDIELTNANFRYNYEDGTRVYDLQSATQTACLNLAVHDSGHLNELLDSNNSDATFDSDSTRNTFESEVLPVIQSAVGDILSEPDGEQRVERILELWKAIREHFTEYDLPDDAANPQQDLDPQSVGSGDDAAGLSSTDKSAISDHTRRVIDGSASSPTPGGSQPPDNSDPDESNADESSSSPQDESLGGDKDHSTAANSSQPPQDANTSNQKWGEKQSESSDSSEEQKPTGEDTDTESASQTDQEATSSEGDAASSSSTGETEHSPTQDESQSKESGSDDVDPDTPTEQTEESEDSLGDDGNKDDHHTESGSDQSESNVDGSPSGDDGEDNKNGATEPTDDESQSESSKEGDTEDQSDGSATDEKEVEDSDNTPGQPNTDSSDSSNSEDHYGTSDDHIDNSKDKESSPEDHDQSSPSTAEPESRSQSIESKGGQTESNSSPDASGSGRLEDNESVPDPGEGNSGSDVLEENETPNSEPSESDQWEEKQKEIERKYDRLLERQKQSDDADRRQYERAFDEYSDILDRITEQGFSPSGLEVADGSQRRQAGWSKIRQDSNQLKRILEQRLRQEKRSTQRRGQRRGQLDPRSLNRVARDDPRVFRQEDNPEEKDYTFVFVLDRSGSMGGEIEAAEQALVTLARALEEIDIEVSIIDMYQSSTRLAKPFGVKTENVLDRLLTGSTGGSTPLADVLRLARERVQGSDSKPAMVVLTDGQPNDKDTYLSELQQTHFPVVGVYLEVNSMSRTQAANRFDDSNRLYDRRKVVIDENEIDSDLRALCREIMF